MKEVLSKGGIPIAILLITVVIAGVMINSKAPPEKKVVEEKAFLVDVEQVRLESLTFVVESQGTVRPKVETLLSAQVSGIVVGVAPAFIEGGFFREGDVLVQLETSDYETDLKLAEAELARAKAALDEERARGKVAEEEWKTVTSTPAPELGLRKPQLAQELANLRGAEAALERAKRNLERTSIRAPYDGMVSAQSVDLGQFLAAGANVGTVFSTDIAEVRMPLSDQELAYVALPGEASGNAEVKLSARVRGQDSDWRGELARSEGVLDEQRRVMYVVAEVKDPYLRQDAAQGTPLRFGQFVTAEIQGTRGSDIVVLPRNVLRLDGTVLTVDRTNTLRIRSVDVQRADEQFVYISAGLRAGDNVVVSPVPNPFDGMAVRLQGDEPSDKDSPDDTSSDIAVTAGENE